MDFKQLQELIRIINKSNIGEITIEEKDYKVTIKQKAEPVQQIMAAPVYAQAPAPVYAPVDSSAAVEKQKPAEPAVSNLLIIKAR